MADEQKAKRLEIAHVLFIDIVGYSKLLTDEQSEALHELNQIVHNTEAAREAESAEQLTILPTGDGMALVFAGSVEEPVECALEISHALRAQPSLPVRMGIHSGPVHHVKDANNRENIAGIGINIAQRVMDCGDAGHILVSKRVADDLAQQRRWQPYIHELGDVEVKHGMVVSLVNLYAETIGNPTPPARLGKVRANRRGGSTVRPGKGLSPLMWAILTVAALLLVLVIAGLVLTPAIIRSLEQHRLAAIPKPTATPTPSLVDTLKSTITREITDKLQEELTHNKNAPAKSDSSISQKSIAVLPFDNLSDDKSNAYFAEGIHDEIVTRLSKIAALKVISRTSTRKYQSSPDNLREVGQQLGVAHIVEGSVQKAGNAVHINVQLIRPATDEHVWAESYNRTLDNVFAVEGEVATAIAEQLQAKLTGSEKETLASKPTRNPAAYDAYLRGLAYEGRIDDLRTSWLNSAQAFAEAVRADPNFALAWAHLASAEALLFVGIEQTSQHRDAATSALEKATQLGPDLVETKIAHGLYLSWVKGDYEGARTILEQAHQLYPNDANVIRMLAATARRQGRWKESRALFEQALELDPRNVHFLADAALVGLETRDAVWARKLLQRALDLSPQNSTVVAELAGTYQLTGDIKQAQTILQGAQPKEGDTFYINILQYNAILLRDYQPAIAMLKAQLEKVKDSVSTLVAYETSLGDLQRNAGEIEASRLNFRKAKAATEEMLRAEPNSADALAALAQIEAGLDEKDAALKHARQAVALMPRSKEPRVGPSYEDTLARLQARFGDKDGAITALQSLIDTSYSYPNVVRTLLQIDPDFDNLHGDPRFEKLCREPNK